MFDLEEDEKHFDGVLRDIGGVDANAHLFDFRDPDLKRKEFNSIRDSVFAELKRQYGSGCQLTLHDDCGGVGTVVDHLIPLKANELNKALRQIKGSNGRKTPSQSFGSNHPDNFVMACRRCNSFKHSKIPTSELINSIFRQRQQKAA